MVCYTFNIMIPDILIFSKQKGSSLSLPAHGWVGARATSSLAAHFALQNTALNPAEKNRAKPEKQKGKKEGGWGEGIHSASLRTSFCPFAIKNRAFPLFSD